MPVLIPEYVRQDRPIIPHIAGDGLQMPPPRACPVEPLKPFAFTPAWIFDYTCVEMTVQRAAAELHKIRVFGKAAWGK